MDNEYLTDEQLFLLSNIKLDSYRVYYTADTGDIYAITNEKLPADCESVEVEFEIVERFLTGKDNIVFFRVEFDDEDALKFVNKKDSPVLYKSNIIEYLRLTDLKDAVLQVIWTPESWKFKLDKKFAETPKGKNLNSRLNFFITKENNINYLVRTIDLSIKKLLSQETVIVEFTEVEEKDPRNIAMFTLPFFRTYGMTIND